MKPTGRLGCLVLVALQAGCGTSLVVTQTTPDAQDPGGVPVNRRATYRVVGLTLAPGVAPGCDAPPGCKIDLDQRLDAVDPETLLSVNVSRQPFASGKLGLTLDARQAIEAVSISSDTGLVRAVEGAAEGLR